MELEKMRAERKELREKARQIVAVADDEKRELSVEEHRAFEDTMTQHDQINARIEREERLQAAETESNRSHRAPTKPELSDAEATPGQARRFRSFGEQIVAAVRAAQPGGFVDPRLQTRAVTGLSEGMPSDGGFLVQTDFSSALMSKVYSTGQVAQRCSLTPISANANGLKIPGIDEVSRADGSRFGGVRAYWTAEAGDKTYSAPSFRQIELNLKKLSGLCAVTDELLADTSALESLLMRMFSQELAFKLDDAIINGDGAGKPLGVLASPALVSVAKEAGQPAATLQPENIIKMWSRMYAPSRMNAVWFINQDIEPQLFTLAIQVGTGGGTVYMPPGGLSGQPYGTLFGRPVIPIEQCATLGTVGDIILADMSQYQLIDKGGMQSATSIHVRFANDETIVRVVYRVDGLPIWNSPLTPFKGSSNTQSPFVVVATRA